MSSTLLMRRMSLFVGNGHVISRTKNFRQLSVPVILSFGIFKRRAKW